MPLAEEPSAPPLPADTDEVVVVEPSMLREPADMEEVAAEPLSPPLPSEIEEIVAEFSAPWPLPAKIEETVVESSTPSLLQELEEFVLQLFVPPLLAEMEERVAEHSRPPNREVPSMHIVKYPPPDCTNRYNESCVCFSKFHNGEEVLMLPCSHLCHLQCAARIDRPRCPYCRRVYPPIA
uniref:RING-type domain-containing protein n=1 Tax=Ananas comosus var. bracteatus TaxID=296719 RepID=A0A6V7QI44_ANACO|nr:unnamed protein product [Ananas comosus var. bracteatus]